MSEGNETVALMVTVAVKVVLSVMMAKMEKASTVLAREALAKMAEWRRRARFSGYRKWNSYVSSLIALKLNVHVTTDQAQQPQPTDGEAASAAEAGVAAPLQPVPGAVADPSRGGCKGLPPTETTPLTAAVSPLPR